MSIPHLVKLLFYVCLAITFSSAVAGQGISPEERQRILVQQDVKAAGNSGDNTFVPFLQETLRERKHCGYEWDDVQMALAKLGEREQQQEIVCVFHQGDKNEAFIAASRQLPYIGGWFAIRLYREMLSKEKIDDHWHRAEPRNTYDVAVVSPRGYAFHFLPKLVPGLPPINEKDWKESQQSWPRYIQEHESELSKLGPTGDGVDFSGSSCKKKPRERSIH